MKSKDASTMTHHSIYFKGHWTIVVYLLLVTLYLSMGCTNESSQPADTVHKQRSMLYQQTTLLTQHAHKLESQLDELRRAEIGDQAIELQKLHQQLKTIKAEQNKLNEQLKTLRRTLKQDPRSP